jgi:hypothetical protein
MRDKQRYTPPKQAPFYVINSLVNIGSYINLFMFNASANQWCWYIHCHFSFAGPLEAIANMTRLTDLLLNGNGFTGA